MCAHGLESACPLWSSFAPPLHKATDGHGKATDGQVGAIKNEERLNGWPTPRRVLQLV